MRWDARCVCAGRNGRCTRRRSVGLACWQHGAMRAAVVQRRWRARAAAQRTRAVCAHVFRPLPRDLQCKILYHVREAWLLERHHYRPLRRIIYRYLDSTPTIVYDDASAHQLLRSGYLIAKYSAILSVQTHLRTWITFVSTHMAQTGVLTLDWD